MTNQGQGNIERSDWTARTARIWWTPEFVELFKVQNTLTQGDKVSAKPKVLENLKRSWKVMEFEELKRVRTLLGAEIFY